MNPLFSLRALAIAAFTSLLAVSTIGCASDAADSDDEAGETADGAENEMKSSSRKVVHSFCDYRVKAPSGANMREQPTTSSKIVVSLANGESLTPMMPNETARDAKGKNGWFHFMYHLEGANRAQFGWIHGDLIEERCD